MATKKEELENPDSCLNKAADDEPIFVIRGNDPLGSYIVDHWYTKATKEPRHKDRRDKLQEAFNMVGTMFLWYEAKKKEERKK